MDVVESEKSDGKISDTKWGYRLFGIVSKFRTRRSWVVIMFLLGTMDVVLNLWHFVKMCDERLRYTMVIGPPSRDLWISMCVFTIVGTVLYFPETANTFSALYTTDGDTLVAIHLELAVTLSFEHIPIAIVDYFVARCRRQFNPAVASWCHIVRVVFIFIRLVWYADMEGRKLRKNDKYEIKQVIVLICLLLYSVTLAFNVLNWHREPKDTTVKHYHLQNVSVYLLKHPSPPEQFKFVIPLTDVLRNQSGSNLDNAQLTNSLLAFLTKEEQIDYSASIMSPYTCHQSVEWPRECDRAQFLSFRFTYGKSELSPYGELRYNFARICPQDSSEVCIDSTETLKDGWKLFLYEAHKAVDEDNVTVEVNVSAPFWKACTHPMPKYSSHETVCSHTNLSNVRCSN